MLCILSFGPWCHCEHSSKADTQASSPPASHLKHHPLLAQPKKCCLDSAFSLLPLCFCFSADAHYVAQGNETASIISCPSLHLLQSSYTLWSSLNYVSHNHV